MPKSFSPSSIAREQERKRENGRKKNEGGKRRKGGLRHRPAYILLCIYLDFFFSLVSLTVSVLLINTQTVPVWWWLVEFFFIFYFIHTYILFCLARALTDGSYSIEQRLD